MNEPILNPWMLYFCLKADSIINMFFIFTIVCFIVSVISIAAFFISFGDDNDSIRIAVHNKSIKIFKYMIFPCLFFMTLKTMCPSTKEIILLMLNSQVNEANISKVSEVTKDVYKQLKEDVFAAIEKSKDTENAVEKKTK